MIVNLQKPVEVYYLEKPKKNGTRFNTFWLFSSKDGEIIATNNLCAFTEWAGISRRSLTYLVSAVTNLCKGWEYIGKTELQYVVEKDGVVFDPMSFPELVDTFTAGEQADITQMYHFTSGMLKTHIGLTLVEGPNEILRNSVILKPIIVK